LAKQFRSLIGFFPVGAGRDHRRIFKGLGVVSGQRGIFIVVIVEGGGGIGTIVIAIE
jgi:hypothetical protein